MQFDPERRRNARNRPVIVVIEGDAIRGDFPCNQVRLHIDENLARHTGTGEYVKVISIVPVYVFNPGKLHAELVLLQIGEATVPMRVPRRFSSSPSPVHYP